MGLQRVSKLPYVPEDADEFERAWLALADIHVAGGKFDLAQVRVGLAIEGQALETDRMPCSTDCTNQEHCNCKLSHM